MPSPILLIIGILVYVAAGIKRRVSVPASSLGESLHSVTFPICEENDLNSCVIEKAQVDDFGISNATETAAHGGVEYFTFIKASGVISNCRVQHADIVKRGGVYWCNDGDWDKGKKQPPVTLHKGYLLVFIPGRDKDTGDMKTFTARLTPLDEPSLVKGKNHELNYYIYLRNCEVSTINGELNCQEPLPSSVKVKSGFTGADQNKVS